ncbi:sensor domain-containing diguanylate cyclase [Megalodesulfovibrio paquesii]
MFSLALVFLPPTLSLGFFAVYAVSFLKDRAFESLHHVLEYDKSFIERWVRERQRDVRFLASLPVVERQELAAMDAVFRQYAATHDDVTGVIFLDASGVNVVDTATSQRLYFQDRDYFKAGQQGQPFITDIFIGRTSGKPIIIFSAPVHVNGRFLGVITTPVRLATVDGLLNMLRIGRQGSAALLDSQGAWYAGAGTGLDAVSEQSTRRSEFIPKEVLRTCLDQDTVIPTTNAQGQRALAAALSINNGRWVLAGQLPLVDVLQEYTAFLLMALLGGGVTLAILTPFLLRLIHSLERPMQDLAEMAKHMAEGRFTSECPMLRTHKSELWEVRVLTDAFCRMQEMVGESVDSLKRMTITDQLTGLYNRRHLLEEGRRIVDVCLRGGRECVCIMADVDRFKQVNDTWGHEVGDTVLQLVADALQHTCRNSDVVARFGGEEIVIVAPNAGLKQGLELAERLRAAVEALVLEVGGERVPLTMSFGVAACIPPSGAHDALTAELVLHDTLRRADGAMYAAKQAGRNQVKAG